jgi:uncharacterized protein YndB with AHSA1/START domain
MDTADRPFVISRTFDVSRDRLFRMNTEEAHLRHWWSPKELTSSRCKVDLRPGGMFHYCLRAPDGSEIWGRWIFREIVPPQRLVVVVSFSDEAGGITSHPMAPDWPREMLSTTTFVERAGRTTLTIRWQPLNPTPVEQAAFDAGHDSMHQGFTGTLDKLEAHIARN